MPLRIVWTVLLLSSLSLTAQPVTDSIAPDSFIHALADSANQKQPKPLKIGVSLTGTTYIGDLGNDNFWFSRFNPGVNFSLQLESPKRLRPQFNVGYGKFTGQYDENTLPAVDTANLPKKFTKNTFFQTTYFCADMRARYTLKPFGSFEPYVSAGGGFFMFSPRDKAGSFLSEKSNTRPIGEKYSTLVVQIPLGAGVQMRINPLLALGIDYTYRYMLTDYVDNSGLLGTRNTHDQLHTLAGTMYISIKEKPKRIEEEPRRHFRSKKDTAEYAIMPFDTVSRSLPIAPTDVLTTDAPDNVLALFDRESDEPLHIEANRIKMGYYALLEPIAPLRPYPDMDTIASLHFFVPTTVLGNPREWMGISLADDAPTFGATPSTKADSVSLETIRIDSPPNESEQAYIVRITRQAVANDDVMYYHPKRRDTLKEIAERYGVSVEVIRIANDLDKNVVKPPLNRYLRIPDLRKYNKSPSGRNY